MTTRDLGTMQDTAVSLPSQTVVDNVASGIVDGAAVSVKNKGACLLQLIYGNIAAGVTGGNIKLIPLHGDLEDGSDLAQVGTDAVTYTFVEGEESGVLEYKYTGGKEFVAVRADNSLTGAAAGSNTHMATGLVVSGSHRYVGNTQFS